MESTLVIIKPDALKRGGVAREVISRLERAGLKILIQKKLTISKAVGEKLYREHRGKSFYEGVVKYMTEAPVLVMVVEGEDVVAKVRRLMGPTHPAEAPPGTIRGDLKGEVIVDKDGIIRNVIHGSDSAEKAEEEMGLFFSPEELQ